MAVEICIAAAAIIGGHDAPPLEGSDEAILRVTKYSYADQSEEDGGHYIDELVCKIEDPVGADTTLYYLQDSNMNVVALANTSGTVVERCWYEPYGTVTFTDSAGANPSTTSSEDNTLTFQGRRLDSETGLYYFRNRYYSPVLGRFTQRDPIEYGDGMNLYEFVGGHPVRGLDPFGEEKSPPEECVVCCVRLGSLFDYRWVLFASIERKMPGEEEWSAWRVCRNRSYASLLYTAHAGYCRTMRCTKYKKRWEILGFAGPWSCASAMAKKIPDTPLPKYLELAKKAAETVGWLSSYSWCNKKACARIEYAEKHTTLTVTNRLLNPEFWALQLIAQKFVEKEKEYPDILPDLVDQERKK